MRIRTVKPQFFTDEKVRSLPYEVRLFFIGLLCFADDAGRFEDDPHLIKAMLFPSDEVGVPEMLDTLEEKRMIKSYKSRKTRYYSIANFHKHQVINRPSKPRTPPPRGRKPSRTRCANTHGALVRNDGLEKEREKEGEKESVSQSEEAPRAREAPRASVGRTERQTDRAFLETLKTYFPEAAIERLKAQFPPERLLWAARKTASAKEARNLARPASYLLRILRDDEQWERHLCDQYALGKEEALHREQQLAGQRERRVKAQEKQKCEREDAAFQKYLQTVPEERKSAITEKVLVDWASQNSIDLERWRKNGWLLKRATQGLYEQHMRESWRSRGRKPHAQAWGDETSTETARKRAVEQ